ncbi:MAG: YigZ family protein [Candidatus Eisenbacteria bacterium]|nr:YigZ family protein [Candidatus Eisenbacteria bacterium]
MNDPDVYTVLASEGFAEIKVKGSRFLGFAFPIRDAGEGAARVETLRKKYHDATHVCFGWRIGHGGGYEQKAADAGEPFGTAGTPIVHALERVGTSDAAVAVVRYFGGVKLGTGGLIRAYGECAREAIDSATRTTRTLRAPLAVLFPYAHAGAVLRLAEKHGARTDGSDYAEEIRLLLAVPASRVERLKEQLIEATAGAVRFPGE